MLYDGAIKRVLVGDEITERALISSALNIADDPDGGARAEGGSNEATGAMSSARTARTLLAFVLFVVMFAIYTSNHPAGFSANVVQTAANKGVLLALVAMAQTFVVITAGIDLSVGAVFVLTNCLASWIVVGTAATAALGVVGVLLAGLACGAVNGLIVIVGRLQPIVTTIATGAVFFGLALLSAPDAGRRRLRRRSPTR